MEASSPHPSTPTCSTAAMLLAVDGCGVSVYASPSQLHLPTFHQRPSRVNSGAWVVLSACLRAYFAFYHSLPLSNTTLHQLWHRALAQPASSPPPSSCSGLVIHVTKSHMYCYFFSLMCLLKNILNRFFKLKKSYHPLAPRLLVSFPDRWVHHCWPRFCWPPWGPL